MSTLRVSNIEAKSDVSDSDVDEKIKITNSNQDVLVFVDGKTTGITTVGINTTNETFKVQGDSNITISGIVTATSFVGTLTGDATGLSGNPSLNTTGIITATTFSGNVTGVAATFTGDVSIGGTLTYEDVNNIDSVGGSNEGCFRSTYEYGEELDWLRETIRDFIVDISKFYIEHDKTYKDKISQEEQKVDMSFWTNVNEPGSTNVIHTHKGVSFACTYNLQTAGTGNLVFRNPANILNDYY